MQAAIDYWEVGEFKEYTLPSATDIFLKTSESVEVSWGQIDEWKNNTNKENYEVHAFGMVIIVNFHIARISRF